MSAFLAALRPRSPPPQPRRWLYVPYDQLSSELGPLARTPPTELGVVLVESRAKAARRPYHQQKLALVLANQRHFALELAERGFAVRYLTGEADYAAQLEPVARELGGLTMMEAAERELRAELRPLIEAGLITVARHEGWLTQPEDFRRAFRGKKTWRMDTFYRYLRQTTGVLMEGGKPRGGQFSFDAENRKPYRGAPPAPSLPRFAPDAITQEVVALVRERFAHHPGRVQPELLPATRADALRLWAWAKSECLPGFGPFEDAMSRAQRTLFHTRLSGLLNLHRLRPREVLDDVLALPLPLPSQEGFVRQLLGWREFMRHVHAETDGFRDLSRAPGGAGPERVIREDEPLPAAYWGTPSGLACLDTVVRSVVEEGYSHHITRLMILSNLATLLGVGPRALTDWFWAMYTDAYDWVVEPNVLGMGTFALGELFITKPYVSGAAYIDRMSDYCASCAFDPKRDCPVTPLYWAFLERNRAALRGNARMAVVLKSAAARSPDQQARDRGRLEAVRAALRAGRALVPEGSTGSES